MTKQQERLNISLVPLALIVAIIVGAGYFLLQGEIKLPKFNNGPQIRRLEGFPTMLYTSENYEKQRLIIKSEEELNEFLNQVDPSGLLEVKERINFDKEFILAVASSTNDEEGHRTKIKKVYENKEDQTLLVLIEELEPGENCKVDQDSNITIDVAAISKTELEIDFDKVKKQDKPCEPEEEE